MSEIPSFSRRKSAGFVDAIAFVEDDMQQMQQIFRMVDKLGASAAYVDQAALVDRLCRELERHMMLEELVLYPAMRSCFDDTTHLAKAIVAHQRMHDLIGQLLGAEADSHLFSARLQVLRGQLAQHCAHKQQQIFPQARRSKLDLTAVGRRMAAAQL
ncbi:MAG: hemerythrin domain-containing protein, partial [Pseudomonadota bacterium]|nr:hemerythrin domain-containing protein [Pseudomonadota bacterium]